MANRVPRAGRAGPPWLLPLLLALLVALIVLGVIFGPRIKDALSSPTATPVSPTPTQVVKTVVVTATPGTTTPTATPNPAIQPSATPSSGQGVVTPLPNTTPIPTVTGLWLGLIAHPQHEVTAIQKSVDRNDPAYAFYLNPVQVVQYDLPHYGFTKGFQIASPAAQPTPTPYTSADGRPAVNVVVNYQNATYTVAVGQPATRGPKGIWLILSIVPGK